MPYFYDRWQWRRQAKLSCRRHQLCEFAWFLIYQSRSKMTSGDAHGPKQGPWRRKSSGGRPRLTPRRHWPVDRRLTIAAEARIHTYRDHLLELIHLYVQNLFVLFQSNDSSLRKLQFFYSLNAEISQRDTNTRGEGLGFKFTCSLKWQLLHSHIK